MPPEVSIFPDDCTVGAFYAASSVIFNTAMNHVNKTMSHVLVTSPVRIEAGAQTLFAVLKRTVHHTRYQEVEERWLPTFQQLCQPDETEAAAVPTAAAVWEAWEKMLLKLLVSQDGASLMGAISRERVGSQGVGDTPRAVLRRLRGDLGEVLAAGHTTKADLLQKFATCLSVGKEFTWSVAEKEAYNTRVHNILTSNLSEWAQPRSNTLAAFESLTTLAQREFEGRQLQAPHSKAEVKATYTQARAQAEPRAEADNQGYKGKPAHTQPAPRYQQPFPPHASVNMRPPVQRQARSYHAAPYSAEPWQHSFNSMYEAEPMYHAQPHAAYSRPSMSGMPTARSRPREYAPAHPPPQYHARNAPPPFDYMWEEDCVRYPRHQACGKVHPVGKCYSFREQHEPSIGYAPGVREARSRMRMPDRDMARAPQPSMFAYGFDRADGGVFSEMDAQLSSMSAIAAVSAPASECSEWAADTDSETEQSMPTSAANTRDKVSIRPLSFKPVGLGAAPKLAAPSAA